MGTTGQGAAVGAVAGGVLGAITGNGKSAAIGAAVGAVAGAVIGHYIDEQNATRVDAAKKYSYDARSNKLELERTTLSPDRVTPGGTVDAAVQYTALAPDTSQQVKVTETRSLVGGKDSVDLGQREVLRPQGTHTSSVKMTLPKDLPKGAYTLVTTISDGSITRVARSGFTVV